MIDRSTNPHSINITVDVPFQTDLEKCKQFEKDFKEITDRFLREKQTSMLVYELKYELEKLLSREEYRGVLLKNDEYFESKLWSLDYLIQQYEKYYPDRVEVKSEYTNIEVNNMLFDLKLKGVIGGYHSPAVCYDLPSHNNKIFDGSYIKVEVPIIKLGNVDEYNLQKRLYGDYELRMELEND